MSDKAEKIPLAYHELCMTRNARTVYRIIVCWAVSLIAVVGLFVFLWLQYDYTSTTTTEDYSSKEYKGVYNIVDADGNVISSDLSPTDIINIMEGLNNGDSDCDKKD